MPGEAFFRDLKHSLRMFWQNRGFTAAAVAALALGIGANTAIFSVVNAVLLKPVPFPDPERLVMLQTTSPQGAGSAASPATFQRQGMTLAIIGVVVGLASSFYLARFVSSFLYGVEARDPLVFSAVPVILAVVALTAVWLPARRASRVDPIIALRRGMSRVRNLGTCSGPAQVKAYLAAGGWT
jgi:hypothetical protein